MGLFKSKEEREKELLEKQEKEIRDFMAKYSLDTLENPNDIALVRNIYYEMKGTGFMKLGMNLSMKAEDSCKVSLLSALMYQNWIMINQLSRISSKLEKLCENKSEL